MGLYAHPISTTPRVVLLLVAENDLKVEHRTVDLVAGENRSQAVFIALTGKMPGRDQAMHPATNGARDIINRRQASMPSAV